MSKGSARAVTGSSPSTSRDTTARRVVQEGLSIVAWVAMWRPLEVLLYDWWPLVSERRVLQRIRAAEVAVVHQPSGSVVPAPGGRN